MQTNMMSYYSEIDVKVLTARITFILITLFGKLSEICGHKILS